MFIRQFGGFRQILVLGASIILAGRAFGIDMSPELLLDHYRPVANALESRYRRVRIVADVTETALNGTKKEFKLQYVQDGDKYTIVEKVADGSSHVFVIAPESSFTLAKAHEGDPFLLNNITPKGAGLDTPGKKETAEIKGLMVLSVYRANSKPLIEILSQKDITIVRVQEEQAPSGKPVIRIVTRSTDIGPNGRQAGVEYHEGSYLLDPGAMWSLQAYEIHSVLKGGNIWTGVKSTMTYGDPIDKTPVLRTVDFDYFFEGKTLRHSQAKIESTVFQTADPVEFTLKGCGFTEEVDIEKFRRLPKSFYWSLVAISIGIIIIVTTRRAKPSRPATTNP